jgi:hypothetical protein
MFYVDEPSTPWWKVVLHKEARSKCIVAKNSEEINTPIYDVIGTKVLLIIPKVLNNIALVGAIELIGTEAILVAMELQRPSDDEEDAMG